MKRNCQDRLCAEWIRQAKPSFMHQNLELATQDIFDGVNKSLSYNGRILFLNSGGKAEGEHSLRVWKGNL